MSTREHQDVVRRNAAFLSGEPFPPSAICSHLAGKRGYVSLARANEVLRDMVANGELIRVGRQYQRASNAAAWLRRAWRKRNDLQIGIEPCAV